MVPDVLVVGAGLAGASAALWARSLGIRVALIEQAPTVGGQLNSVHFQPMNFAGATAGEGPAIAEHLHRQLAHAGIEARFGTAAARFEAEGPAVCTAEGERIEAHALLIAVGVRRRRLEADGADTFEGRGVSYSATQDRARFAGTRVAVVGGGDAAFENALLLAQVGCSVTLVVRGVPRARASFRERVAATGAIEVLANTRVTAVHGDGTVRGVSLEGPHGTMEREVAAVVVKIGVIPNSEWCAPALARDADGYLAVDRALRTSHPRAWAAGDITRPPVFAMSVAAGQGALAVAAIRVALGDFEERA